MVQRRPMYDAEFREDALQILRETKRSIRQVSEDLGISQWTLRGWYRAEVKKTKSEGRPQGRKRAAGEQMEQSLEAKLKELEAENRQLNKRVKELEQDRAILKKAATFFARESD